MSCKVRGVLWALTSLVLASQIGKGSTLPMSVCLSVCLSVCVSLSAPLFFPAPIPCALTSPKLHAGKERRNSLQTSANFSHAVSLFLSLSHANRVVSQSLHPRVRQWSELHVSFAWTPLVLFFRRCHCRWRLILYPYTVCSMTNWTDREPSAFTVQLWNVLYPGRSLCLDASI